jgi:general secretion pathway protein M
MIKTYWQQISPRERIMLVIGAGAVTLTMLYLLIWLPLTNGIVREQQGILLHTEQLSTMQAQAIELRQLKGGSGNRQRVTDSSSLLSLVDRTATELRIKASLNKIQPDGNDGVRLWLDSANFDQMMQWLHQLEQQHGVYVTDISIEHAENPGRINSRILLRVTQ